MRLVESEKANPQNYFLEDGEGGFTLPNQDIVDYAPNKALRKRVFDGAADIVFLSDRIQIYWKDSLVAEAQLVAQLSDNGGLSWDYSYDFNFADASINKITEIEGEDEDGNPIQIPVTPFYRAFELKDFPAISVTDAVMGMDQHWAFKDTKQIFYLDVPSWLVRIRWQCRIKDSALSSELIGGGLKYSVADYQGEVNHGSQADPEEGWTQHWWTFEPNGYQCPDADARTPQERFEDRAGFYIDPYLWVDEQATYFDIYQDGFVSRIWSNGSEAFIGKIYDPDNVGTTDWFSFGSKVVVGGTTYAISEDLGIVVTLIENTPLRVVLRVQGNFEDSSQTDLSGEQDSILYLFFYPDKIAMRIELNVTGTITLSDNANNGLIFMDSVIANISNEDSKYESSGSEVDAGGDGSQAGADYIATLSDEIDVMGVAIESSLGAGDGTYIQYIDDPGVALRFGWNNGTITADTELEVIWVFDSLDREGSAKIYNSTDRLAIGDQFKDPILDQSPSKGDDVTDMILPARISSGTLHSDGAHFYEPDSNDELQITLDRARIRPAFVIVDWPFQTGTLASPTDHLLCYLKCNDNAASSQVTDYSGNSEHGAWYNEESERNTNTAGDSVQEIGRDRNLDTQDGPRHIRLTAGSGTVHDNSFFKKGSVLIKFAPQFGAAEGARQQIFDLRVTSSDYIRLYYDVTNDRWYAGITWGGGSTAAITGTTLTSDYELIRETTIIFCWDSDKDSFFLIQDGQILGFGSNTDIPTTSHPISLRVGIDYNANYDSDIIIDEIKTLDEAILPFGAFFIGNGQGLLADIDTPHKDLCFFWDAQSTSAKGGSNLASDKTGTLGSGNSGGTTSFPTSGGIVGGFFDNESNAANYYIRFPWSADDILDPDKGRMGLWMLWNTVAASDYIFSFGAGSDYFVVVNNGSNYFGCEISVGGQYLTTVTAITPVANLWYFLDVQWDIENDRLDLAVNGVRTIGTSTVTNSWSASPSYINFCADTALANNADISIGRGFIAKEPDTPLIWTAFGKPLHMPVRLAA